jgi:hypothetical protein
VVKRLQGRFGTLIAFVSCSPFSRMLCFLEGDKLQVLCFEIGSDVYKLDNVGGAGSV